MAATMAPARRANGRSWRRRDRPPPAGGGAGGSGRSAGGAGFVVTRAVALWPLAACGGWPAPGGTPVAGLPAASATVRPVNARRPSRATDAEDSAQAQGSGETVEVVARVASILRSVADAPA